MGQWTSYCPCARTGTFWFDFHGPNLILVSTCPCICPFVRAMVLKLHVWIPHGKIVDLGGIFSQLSPHVKLCPFEKIRMKFCLLSFTCNYVVSVLRGFLLLWVLGMGCFILLWHSLSLPYNYLVRYLKKYNS